MLVEGKAIQVHPLVCQAFNADFDGDQMAVHLPLSAEAQAEARVLMLSSNNILSPASGRPLATPSQDMVLGAYFLTYCEHDLQTMSAEQVAKAVGVKGLKRYRTEEDVEFSLDSRAVDYQDPIEYTWSGELLVTTPGRVIFNAEVKRALDEATGGDFEVHRFLNKTLTKRELDTFIGDLVEHYGPNTIAAALDVIKSVTFRFATRAGITISKNDIVPPGDKEEILAGFEEEVTKVGKEYDRGLMTEEERDERIIAIWTRATDQVADRMMDGLEADEPDLHDGQLGRPRIVQPDPPARRHARPHGRSEGRDHHAADQGQLHGGAHRPRVLHLDPRRAQGSRGHRAADRRLGLPHAAARRRLPGRHRPRVRLRHRGVHRARRSSSTTRRTRASPGGSRRWTS